MLLLLLCYKQNAYYSCYNTNTVKHLTKVHIYFNKTKTFTLLNKIYSKKHLLSLTLGHENYF